MQIALSNIVTCFSGLCVGTKVLDADATWSAIQSMVQGHDFSQDRTPGQAFLHLPVPPQGLSKIIRAGEGKRTMNPGDYHPVPYRDRIEMFLHPRLAAGVTGWAAIVYTREAYLKDPDTQKDKVEYERFSWHMMNHEFGEVAPPNAVERGVEYVLVALLAFAGPKPVVSERRFVANLAGGNNEYAAYTLAEIKQLADEVTKYNDEWCSIADCVLPAMKARDSDTPLDETVKWYRQLSQTEKIQLHNLLHLVPDDR